MKSLSFLEQYKTKFVPQLVKELSLGNAMAAPKVEKVVLNVGIRSDMKDPKAVENIIEDFKKITGQQPVKTLAKKSISSFKVREGQVVGVAVTLRGKRMYEFLNKLFNVTLARVRDFRGVDEKGFDKFGNYTIGFKDQVPFPEISADQIKTHFGMQVTIVVKSRKPEHARTLLTMMGLPLKKQEVK